MARTKTMRKLKKLQNMQIAVAGAWDFELHYRILLQLNIGQAGNLRTTARFSNTGFRLSTQTF